MSRATDIFDEVEAIVESHRISTAMTAEALLRRSDALAELALSDSGAVDLAMRTAAATHLYAKFESKVELVLNNQEQAEAVMQELENNEDADDNGNDGRQGGAG